jgi:23S rRNA (adenine2030-N6)-methyltransferase
MLSYLHEFHAGNHADVLKHVVLVQLLERLTAKEKPLRYVETHAGGGSYDLRGAAAQKNREYADGVGRLWDAADAPPAVQTWLERVRAFNGTGPLTRYPGSPVLAAACLRPIDRLFLYELHPAEHRRLERALGNDRRATVLRADGLRESLGLLPPPERRGLLFVDPSYETKDEQQRVVDLLAKAHRRFGTGVYAIWYPLIDGRRHARFERAVASAVDAPVDVYELRVAADGSRAGLVGSGVMVVNPPWMVREALGAALPWLAARLGAADGSFRAEAVGAPAR